MCAGNLKNAIKISHALNERSLKLAKGRGKDYFCTVVSEDVEINLKRKHSSIFESKGKLFVQCNQYDCQYVDINEYPCPLSLNLFDDKIGKYEERIIDTKE